MSTFSLQHSEVVRDQPCMLWVLNLCYVHIGVWYWQQRNRPVSMFPYHVGTSLMSFWYCKGFSSSSWVPAFSNCAKAVPPLVQNSATTGHGIGSANRQSLWRLMGERSSFLARQYSWFSWYFLLVVSRVEVCLWFLKVLFKLLKRNSFSWGCPFQCFMFSVSQFFPVWYCQWDVTSGTGVKLMKPSVATYAVFLSPFSYCAGNADLDGTKWSAGQQQDVWQHGFSSTAMPTALPHSALFSSVWSQSSVWGKAKEDQHLETMHQYHSTETMIFCSSLYSFNTSKQWPTLVTCDHGMFTKPLHVGDCLSQTLHSYLDLKAESAEFTLCSSEVLAFRQTCTWSDTGQTVDSLYQSKKNSGQVVPSAVVQPCFTAYIIKKKMFICFGCDSQIFDA